MGLMKSATPVMHSTLIQFYAEGYRTGYCRNAQLDFHRTFVYRKKAVVPGVVCRAAVYCRSSLTHYYLQCLDFFQEAVSDSLVLLIF